jgi:hypothetical protein
MAEKALALRLADQMLHYWDERGPDAEEVAAELRRLHGIEFALRDCEKALEGMAKKYMDAHDQRDELLEALQSLLWYVGQLEELVYSADDAGDHEEVAKARAAIAKAEGKK